MSKKNERKIPRLWQTRKGLFHAETETGKSEKWRGKIVVTSAVRALLESGAKSL